MEKQNRNPFINDIQIFFASLLLVSMAGFALKVSSQTNPLNYPVATDTAITSNTSIGTGDSNAKPSDPNLSTPSVEVKITSPASGFAASRGFDVSISSRYAEAVSLALKNKSTNSVINLGKDERVSNDAWKKNVASSILKNGEYYLQASAAYQGKEYKSEPVSIAVKFPETVSPTPAQTDAAISDKIKTVESYVKFSIPSAGATISGDEMRVEIKAFNAGAIEVLVRDRNSSVNKYITQASKISTDTWGTKIGVRTRIPNGDYYLVARMKDSAGIYKESSVAIKIFLQEAVSAPVENETASNQKDDVSESDASVQIPPSPDEAVMDSGEDGISGEKEKALGTDQKSRDTDRDGLSDSEELRIGTDPKNPDSDRDGYLDGDEIRNGFDPLKFSPGDERDKIAFESPKNTGKTNREYEIKNVELEKRDSENNILKLRGKAIPNSFVTIYIFSDPIIITLKTDAEGNWEYELDKQLEDGEHEAYVAITDNTGKITSKSEPLRFVKTAEAATVIPNAQAQEVLKNQTPAQKSKDNFVIFAFVAVVVFLGIALAVVGIINHKHVYDKGSDQ